VTHKVITIWTGEGPDHRGKKHRHFPYADSSTPIHQSIAEIKTLLNRFTCERIIDYSETGRDSVALHTVGFEKDGNRFLIEFPITYTENKSGKKLNMSVSGRIVLNRVKALLIDAEIEAMSFQEAMLPYLLLPTTSGRPMTVSDILTLPDIGERSRETTFLLGDGGNR
jgi:hypothetical protein